MQAEELQVRARCGEMVEKIKMLYGMDLSQVHISFDLRGRAAGKAGGRGYGLSGASYYVKFNRDMLTREAFEHVIRDSVPHEYAHVVCFMDRTKGKNHDYGWARVCRELGGTGDRTHNEEVVYGKGITYEYTTDRGHKVRLSEKRHRYIQAGGRLMCRRGMGALTQMCAHSIVGHRGQTLAQPVVRQGTKEVPVQTLLPVVNPALVQRPTTGESKAATSRRIMLSGHRAGKSYEQIIAAMMLANGYDRQLARATYKANCLKVGVPQE